MNLDLFDNMDGLVLRERENNLYKQNMGSVNDNKASMTSEFPRSTPLAMAYVPYQNWGEVYDDDTAIKRGTLFPDLDLPFGNGGGME